MIKVKAPYFRLRHVRNDYILINKRNGTAKLQN
jgi:hypothetical protein